jgi:hypothetical protein
MIPTPSTALIGREREIDALCTLFEQPEVRLVTLTGAGGFAARHVIERAPAQALLARARQLRAPD